MSADRRTRTPASSGRRLALEPLERRMLLTGDVTVFLSGFDLIIQGDADDNNIMVSQATVSFEDQFEISSPDGTTINGGVGPRVFEGVFGNIQFFMGDGSDTVVVQDAALPGSLLFDGGDGDNSLTIDPVTVAGNVTVKNGFGADTLNISETTIGGSLLVDNGEGITGLIPVQDGSGGSDTQIGSVSIGGNLTVKNKAGVDLLLLADFEVDGNVTIDNGDGGTPLVVTADEIAFDGSLTQIGEGDIVGNLTIRNKKGVDEQLLVNLSVGGSVLIDNGEGSAVVFPAVDDLLGPVTGSETSIQNATIGGNLSIKNKDGVDVQSFDELSVGGNVSISNGDGGSLITFSETPDTVIIDGNLTIKNKDGIDEMYLTALQVGGNIAIDNGTGGSEVASGFIVGPSAVGGSLSIRDKTGLLVAVDAFEVGGNLSITGGIEGIEALVTDSLIHGSLSFRGKGADDALSVAGTEVEGDTNVRDGKGAFDFQSVTNLGTNFFDGNLTVKNQGGALTATIDQTQVGGDLSISNKNDGSIINLDPIALVSVQGGLTIKTGNGADLLTLLDVLVAGPVSIRTGGGDDTVTLNSMNTGSTTSLDGGQGLNDSLTLSDGAFAFAPVYVNFENVTII